MNNILPSHTPGKRLQPRPAQHVPAAGGVAAQHDAHAEGDARGRRRRHRPRQGQRAVHRQPDITGRRLT